MASWVICFVSSAAQNRPDYRDSKKLKVSLSPISRSCSIAMRSLTFTSFLSYLEEVRRVVGPDHQP